MNLVKSPYQLLLEQLGLSPAQQSLTPEQMQAEMITRGQTPPQLQQQPQPLYMAAGGAATAPTNVNPNVLEAILTSPYLKGLGRAGMGSLGGLTAVSGLSDLPSHVAGGEYGEAASDVGNVAMGAQMIAPKLLPKILGPIGTAAMLYDVLKIEGLNKGEEKELEERRKATDAYLRSLSPVFKQ